MEFILGFISGALCSVFLIWFAAWTFNRLSDAEKTKQDAHITARQHSFTDR